MRHIKRENQVALQHNLTEWFNQLPTIYHNLGACFCDHSFNCCNHAFNCCNKTSRMVLYFASKKIPIIGSHASQASQKLCKNALPCANLNQKQHVQNSNPVYHNVNHSKQAEAGTIVSETAYVSIQATQSCTGVVLKLHPQAINLMKWAALQLELLSPAYKQELLNFPSMHGRCWLSDTQSHQKALSTVGRNATTLQPFTRSWYSNRTSVPQYGCPTRSMQGTGSLQRGSRWWIYIIWKEAAAIMCGSMSHCSTKSFYLHISFLHMEKANIMKLCCSTKRFCCCSMLKFLLRNAVGKGAGNAGESAEGV